MADELERRARAHVAYLRSFDSQPMPASVEIIEALLARETSRPAQSAVSAEDMQERCAQVAERHAAPAKVVPINYDVACHDIAAAIRALPISAQSGETLAHRQAREVMHPASGGIMAPSSGTAFSLTAQSAVSGEVEAVVSAWPLEVWGGLRTLPVAATAEQREVVRKSDLYALGDARLMWVNEGDLAALAFAARPETTTDEGKGG